MGTSFKPESPRQGWGNLRLKNLISVQHRIAGMLSGHLSSHNPEAAMPPAQQQLGVDMIMHAKIAGQLQKNCRAALRWA